jgi:hypothetical protein
LKDTPEKSDRQIAGGLGVSHVTVAGVRDDLEESGQIDHFSKRIDPRTGKQSQPSTRASKKKPRTVLTRNAKEEERAADLFTKMNTEELPSENILDVQNVCTDTNSRQIARRHSERCTGNVASNTA